ncbi:MAG: hypothetical protein ACD_57C00076G0003 [uncultured bacterium]|nr:MAG: hypothetical protein ACD_57C00076G0003 [uncultured bacterium]OGE04102.1 MAG: hypothetical protein A2362_01045 [Candidatus Curtissbacteria bacterium RIFOXYB1_FULL_41_59]OGE07264.1 MAG: hypothetical protein A2615_01005 [Candidatus Curtissbacteria bacterium RIFOXYD1_FULL_41_36]OGE11305.1 MAG: hypothetical protein A2470_05750 [Candidatus Curtissbacteria bacterium RIFOXYC2_FULL_41_11]OGE12724.1 MAG: hypothetical protein A3J89_04210 [Candidatus Curtissbacteria bacterium RIFOXYB12_FULL_40_6]O
MVERFNEGKRPKRRNKPVHLREPQDNFGGVVLPTPPSISELSKIAGQAVGARVVKTRPSMKTDGLKV